MRFSVVIRGRQRVLTGMLRYGVMVPYHKDPGFTRDHWRAYSLRRIGYGGTTAVQ